MLMPTKSAVIHYSNMKYNKMTEYYMKVVNIHEKRIYTSYVSLEKIPIKISLPTISHSIFRKIKKKSELEVLNSVFTLFKSFKKWFTRFFVASL